ncbi:MAG: DNA-binding MarR family transcriptional regulator [Salibacteraceae bacterium]|jgi:DNA-binding MarR family transcriptional regulator
MEMRLEEELKMSSEMFPHQRATLNVIFTGAWMSERMNSLLKPFGISEQQYNILRILRGQKGNTLNLQEISERMVHKMSNTTRLVEKMRIKELIIREVCPENRRKVNISILPAGLELIELIMSTLNKSETDIEERLSINEATTLAHLLDKIRG